MGEAKQRARAALNGHVLPPSGRPAPQHRIPVYENIKLETTQGVVMMMLGNKVPEAATALDPDKARELARALVAHADRLEPESRIIMP